jgi:hypothetical protein
LQDSDEGRAPFPAEFLLTLTVVWSFKILARLSCPSAMLETQKGRRIAFFTCPVTMVHFKAKQPDCCK